MTWQTLCLTPLLAFSLFSCKTRPLQATHTTDNANITESNLRFEDIAAKGLPRKSKTEKNLVFRIIHTNDLHSAIDMFPSLSAFIEQQKKFAHEHEILPIYTDAGDLYSGTVGHTLGPRRQTRLNPELEFLRRHGAVTIFGNHEWDATQEGLATMISKVSNDKDFTGQMLATNIILKNPNPQTINALEPYFFDGIVIKDEQHKIIQGHVWDSSELQHVVGASEISGKPLARALVQNYRIGHQTFKVGFVGMMGKSAIGGSLATRKGSGVDFHDYKGIFVAEYVARLRDLGCDLIIGILHGGKQEEGVHGDEEDKLLAKAIPGIDMVSAGHTHAGYTAKRNDDGVIRYQSPAHGQAVVTDFSYETRNQSRLLFILNSKIEKKNELLNAWNHSKENYKTLSKFSASELLEWKQEFDHIVSDDARYEWNANLHLTHDTEILHLKPNTVAAKELGDASSYESKKILGQLVTTAVREELNETLLKQNQKPVDLFFTAIELVRTEFPTHRPTYFADIFGMVSRGVMEKNGNLVPDGGRITITDMSTVGLYGFIGFLEFYSRMIEVEATMAYSEGVKFTHSSVRDWTKSLYDNLSNIALQGFSSLPSQVRVAMPTFLSDNFRDAKLENFYGFAIPQQINPFESEYTMDVLLARYLSKHRRDIETKGVVATAPQRAETLKQQKLKH